MHSMGPKYGSIPGQSAAFYNESFFSLCPLNQGLGFKILRLEANLSLYISLARKFSFLQNGISTILLLYSAWFRVSQEERETFLG